MNNEFEQQQLGSVAIIGMSGRFPGAKNVTELWRNIRDGVESVSFFPDEELLSSGIDPAVLSNPNFVKAGAVLDDVELFDARFFGIAPREAESMDPQQRLFIECAWHALEDAGYDSATFAGRIGVYGGTGVSTYVRQLQSNPEFVGLVGAYQIALGNDKDFLTTHVSYKLNLRGPSVVVQSACSTSLVAVHIACQSLLDHQCDIALAGGVNIKTPQTMGYFYQEDGIFSPDGHCRPFDAKARGIFSGNGLGIVVLKRLADAEAEGDCIHAVIRGSAINNDGSLKVGYTAPSLDGEAQAIITAQTIAGVDPETITYVETHGTATAIGDPIEIAALTQAFRVGTDKKNFCAIGSIKSNFGHLDSAAGVAGLIKAVLALKHKLLPPSLNFEQPNPVIDFSNSPFYVNTKLSDWKKGVTPRRAGVSSFGIGGTNVHVVLEEAPPNVSTESSRPYQLLVLSAKTRSALDAATANLAEHLKRNANLNLADVAYTLQVGRTSLSHRRMLVSSDLEDVVASLETLDPNRVVTEEDGKHRSIAFLFPGHGSECVNMGLEVYRNEPTFRQQIDVCSEILMPDLKLDLRHVLYPEPCRIEEATEQLEHAAIFQSSLFAVDYALAKVWMEWGIRPHAMMGHSTGEYVAACLAGVFSLEDGLRLIAKRGQLMEQTPEGAMLAVPLSESDLEPLLGDGLSLAAVNGPSLCVVSGTLEAVHQLECRLAANGEECRRLHSSHAYHSMSMEPALRPLVAELKNVHLRAPAIPFVSNVTGTWVTTSEATDPSYWATHLCQTVRFSQGIQLLLKEPNRILLEVGPGGTLGRLASSHIRRLGSQKVFSSLHRLPDEQPDRSSLQQTLGRLWLSGIQVNWSGFYARERRLRVSLPPYPFERQRYWIERKPRSTVESARQGSLLRTPEIPDWFYIPSWKRTMLPAPFKAEALESQKSCWMVFADECGLAQEMVKCLKQAEQVVVTVTIGNSFGKLSDSRHFLDPANRADYDSLLRSLKASGVEPNRIVHFWSISTDGRGQPDGSFFEQSQMTGFHSLLYLAQALEKAGATHKLDIVVVSNHLLAATGEEVAFPEKATILGPCQVIPQEYMNISCRAVDIVLPEPGSRQQTKLTQQLLAEITEGSLDYVIAYRGNRRLVRSYERVRLERSAKPVRRLREGGVYLLTGGLGNVGLHLADHLAKSLKAKLILLGRSSFPERTDWENWLSTHPDQDDVSSKIRRMLGLERLGAEVMVVSADIADEKQVQWVLDLTNKRFGEINGVFHLAADTRPGSVSCPISKADEHKAAFQFRPKVYGTYVLAKLLQGRDLDFCVLFSSNASILGGLGLVAYSAANHFLDSFVTAQNGTGLVTWITTNWDGWPREGAKGGPRQGSIDDYMMDARESVEALELVISLATAEQVVVSAGDLAARLNVWIRREFLQRTEDTEHIPALHARPPVQSTYAPPLNDTQQTIADIWQKLLGVDRVGINDNFLELGGHSLLAMQLTSRLRQVFQLEVPVRIIFESPTPATLAEAIRSLKGVSEVHPPVIPSLPREPRRVSLTETSDSKRSASLGNSTSNGMPR
jgi:acyl transferase domain-containing protein